MVNADDGGGADEALPATPPRLKGPPLRTRQLDDALLSIADSDPAEALGGDRVPAISAETLTERTPAAAMSSSAAEPVAAGLVHAMNAA